MNKKQNEELRGLILKRSGGDNDDQNFEKLIDIARDVTCEDLGEEGAFGECFEFMLRLDSDDLENILTKSGLYDKLTDFQKYLVAASHGKIEEVIAGFEEFYMQVTPAWQNSVIYILARRGNLAALKLLEREIERLGLDVEKIFCQKNYYGYVPIIAATANDKKDVIKYLISKAPDCINQSSKDNENIAHIACEYNQSDLVEFLHKRKPDLFDETNESNKIPFTLALEKGCVDIVKYLAGKNPSWLDLVHGYNNENPAHIVAEKGYIEIVDFLYKEKPELFKKESKYTGLPIRSASLYGHKNIIEFFAQEDPSLLKDNKDIFETVLYAAIEFGRYEIVKLLLEIKGDIFASLSFRVKGKNPLLLAARAGNEDLVELIINSNPAWLQSRDKELNNVAHIAAELRHFKVVKLLYQKSPEIFYKKNKSGNNVLLESIRALGIDIFKYLYDVAPDLFDSKNNQRQNVAHIAVDRGSVEIIKFLFEKKPELFDVRDENQRIPFLLSTGWRHKKAFEYLINKNPGYFQETTLGDNPKNIIHLAAINDGAHILEYVIKNYPQQIDSLYNGKNLANLASKEKHSFILRDLIKLSRSDMLRGYDLEGERTGIEKKNISNCFGDLKHCPIGVIDFSDIGISDIQAKELLKELLESPNITQLNLDNNPDIDDATLQNIKFITKINSKCANLPNDDNLSKAANNFYKFCQLIDGDRFDHMDLDQCLMLSKMLIDRQYQYLSDIRGSEFYNFQFKSKRSDLNLKSHSAAITILNYCLDRNFNNGQVKDITIFKDLKNFELDDEEFYCLRAVHLLKSHKYEELVKLLHFKASDYFKDPDFRDILLTKDGDVATRSVLRALSPVITHCENGNKLENLQRFVDQLEMIEFRDFDLDRFVKRDLITAINNEIEQISPSKRRRQESPSPNPSDLIGAMAQTLRQNESYASQLSSGSIWF